MPGKYNYSLFQFARIDEKREAEIKRKVKPVEINKWENEKNGGDPADKMEVTGDVKMDIDLNKEIEADQAQQS